MRLRYFYAFLGGVAAAYVCALTFVYADSPTDAAQTHVDHSIAAYLQGNLPGAIVELREALSLRPNDPQLHFMLGNALYRHGELQGAADAYRATLELQPNHFEAHMSRGFTLYELAEFEQAVTEWLTAVRLNPKEPFARAGLAVGLYRLGHVDEARERYAEALALDKRYRNLENLRRDIRWKEAVLGAVKHLLERLQTGKMPD